MRVKMKQHSFQSHGPEEMRYLSNLGHIVEALCLPSWAGLPCWEMPARSRELRRRGRW